MRDLVDYQSQYSSQPFERYQVQFRRKKVSEILARTVHDNMLEVGCGLDSIFNSINSYRHLYVVEPAQGFYEQAVASQMLSDRAQDIRIIHKFVEDCVSDLATINLDFILISALLHEISEQDFFLQKIHQLCSHNTVVHINTPNARSFHRLLALEMGLINDLFQKSESNLQFQQHGIFDVPSLTSLAERNGFRVIETGTFIFKPFTHQQMESMMQGGFITEQMLEGFYNMEKYLPEFGSEVYVNLMKK